MNVLFIGTGNYQKYYNDNISPHVKLPGEALRREGINLDYYFIKGKGILGYVKNIPKIRQILKYKNIDIIHAHYGYSGIVSDFARTDQKLVVSFLGSDLLGSVNTTGQYKAIGNFVVQLNKLFSSKRYDYTIVKSMKMREVVQNLHTVSVIPNGVDLETFRPIDKMIARKKLNIEILKKIVLFVADPDMLVKNFNLAKNAISKDIARNCELLVIYGKTHEELNLYFNAADVLLLTSFHEGSPNVVKEAMACNCPIVSTDVGDVRETIKGTGGTYLCTFDKFDVRKKILSAINFNKRTNGRENIQHLEKSNIAKRMICIYRKVLK